MPELHCRKYGFRPQECKNKMEKQCQNTRKEGKEKIYK